MELKPNVGQQLFPLLEQLKQLEPLIYSANDGKAREHFEHLLAPEFWEIGASGQQYSRQFVLDVLEARHKTPYTETWQATDHHLQMIATDLYLFSYTLHQPTRISKRTSIWRQAECGWKLVYHQGTVIQNK
jgi:hypothetical protein